MEIVKKTSGLWMGILLLCLASTGCQKIQVLEERYPTGERLSAQSFLLGKDSVMLRHGLQVTWYPGGRKQALQTFEYGSLQGYAIRWYPSGKVQSIEHYKDGALDKEAKY